MSPRGLKRRLNAVAMLGVYALFIVTSCYPSGGDSLLQSRRDALVLSQQPGAILNTEVGADGRAAGYISASGEVAPSTGAATYTIPLWTPAGRAGIQPSLSLNYSSQELGNGGWTGYGWRLSGLSTISRCGRRRSDTEGSRQPYFENGAQGDRYCLDGQLLVAVSGSYGGEGTEYRAEVDGFQKVVSLNVGPHGPRTFRVYATNGTVSTYGEVSGHENALLEGQRIAAYFATDEARTFIRDTTQHVVWAWGVSRVEDTSGNYLTVGYRLDGDTFAGYEWLPSNIKYTGSTKGLLPQREVRFEYEADRPTSGYVSGFKTRHTLRLKEVQAYGPTPEGTTALLKRYRLSYQQSETPEETYTLLSSAEECDGAGVCLRPRSFTYEKPKGAEPRTAKLPSGCRLVRQPNGPIPAQYICDRHIGDLNGDGLDDVLYLGPGQTPGYLPDRYRYELSGPYNPDWLGGGAIASGLTPVYYYSADKTLVTDTGVVVVYREYFSDFDGEGNALVDINGDGRADFMGTRHTFRLVERDGAPYVEQSSGNQAFLNVSAPDSDPSFQSIYEETPTWPRHSASWRILNWNGNDRADYLGYDNETQAVYLAEFNPTTNAFGARAAVFALSRPPQSQGFQTATQTLDGRTAFGGGESLVVLQGDGDLRQRGYRGPMPAGARVYYADMDGDGLSDAVINRPSASGWYVDIAFNTGNGYEAAAQVALFSHPLSGSADSADVYIGDRNNNGRYEVGRYELKYDHTLTAVADEAKRCMADFNGDGVAERFECTYAALQVPLSTHAQRPMLTRVDAGNIFDTFEYTHTGNRTAYTPGTPPTQSSLMGWHRGVWMVRHHRRFWQQEPAPAQPVLVAHRSYTYGNSLADRSGRGWLGFGLVTVKDEMAGAAQATITTRWNLEEKLGQFYMGVGRPSFEERGVTVDGVRYLTRRQHDYASVFGPVSGATARLSNHIISESHCEQGTSGPTVYCYRQLDTQTVWDAYGNVTISESSVRWEPVGSGWAQLNTVRTTTTYEPPDTGRWLVARPKLRKVLHHQGSPAVGHVNTTGFISDPVTGLITDMVREPDSTDTSVKLTVHTDYTPYGLPWRSTGTDLNSLQRSSGTIEYDPVEAMLAVRTQRGAMVSKASYHPGLGLVLRGEDVLGVATTYSYDGLGRPRKVDAPHQGDSSLSYQQLASGGLSVTHSWLVRGGSSPPVTTRTEYDALGRQVRMATWKANGTPVYVDTVYDDFLGLSVQQSLPYEEGQPRLLARRESDVMGRLRKLTRADGVVTATYFYGPLQTRRVDVRGVNHETLFDGRGLVTRTLVSDGVDVGLYLPTDFIYDQLGQLQHVVRYKDSTAVYTSYFYDVLGRRTYVFDPDEGIRHVNYNAFGEVVSSNDDVSTRFYTHDELGRVKTISTQGGAAYTYVWDTQVPGELTSATSPDGITTSYFYDAWGRPSTTRWQVGGESFDITSTYDDFGRLASLSYPAVGSQRLKVIQDYDTLGQPAQVYNASTYQGYWYAGSRNAQGQLLDETFFSGVTTRYAYDGLGRLIYQQAQRAGASTFVQKVAYGYYPDGNLQERHDVVAGTSEDFFYDAVDRLSEWDVTQQGRRSYELYHYDTLGNLTERRVDAGPGHGMTLAYTGSQPHLPSSITQLHQPERKPRYSAVGNLEWDGLSLGLSYTDFDLPRGTSIGGAEGTFYRYDAQDSRVLKQLPNGDEVLTLAGGLYERRTEAGVRTHVFTVQGGGKPVVQVQWKEGSGGTLSEFLLFLHAERGGTPSVVTNSLGTVVERLKFDPWGARREVADFPAPYISSSSLPLSRRGFQGHSLDAESALVNMQGRMYDSSLGLFLSPDPNILDPLHGPTYNRYRFGFNNPLKYRDPSGFQADPIGISGSYSPDGGFSGPDFDTGFSFPPPYIPPPIEWARRDWSRFNFQSINSYGDGSIDGGGTGSSSILSQAVVGAVELANAMEGIRIGSLAGGYQMATGIGTMLWKTLEDPLFPILEFADGVYCAYKRDGGWGVAGEFTPFDELYISGDAAAGALADRDYVGAGYHLTNFGTTTLSSAASVAGAARSLGSLVTARPTGGVSGLSVRGVRSGAVGPDIVEAEVFREIGRGEKWMDLVREVDELTRVTDLEHAIVSLPDGRRLLLYGGRDGFNITTFEVKRLLLHSHTRFSLLGPSPDDFATLEAIRGRGYWPQRSSYLLEVDKEFPGNVMKYYIW